jgi:hypothetical protein
VSVKTHGFFISQLFKTTAVYLSERKSGRFLSIFINAPQEQSLSLVRQAFFIAYRLKSDKTIVFQFFAKVRMTRKTIRQMRTARHGGAPQVKGFSKCRFHSNEE